MLEQLTKLRNTHLCLPFIIKEVVKDQMYRQKEEMHRMGGLEGSFFPVELGCTTTWHVGVLDPRALLTP